MGEGLEAGAEDLCHSSLVTVGGNLCTGCSALGVIFSPPTVFLKPRTVGNAFSYSRERFALQSTSDGTLEREENDASKSGMTLYCRVIPDFQSFVAMIRPPRPEQVF